MSVATEFFPDAMDSVLVRREIVGRTEGQKDPQLVVHCLQSFSNNGLIDKWEKILS